jgi:hypothetical protein
MKRNDWNKKTITYLYGKKNLILTLGIYDPISKKPTCILSPINQGVYYPYFFLYIFHIRPPLFSHWKPILTTAMLFSLPKQKTCKFSLEWILAQSPLETSKRVLLGDPLMIKSVRGILYDTKALMKVLMSKIVEIPRTMHFDEVVSMSWAPMIVEMDWWIQKFLKHGSWLRDWSIKFIINLRPQLRVLNWLNE